MTLLPALPEMPRLSTAAGAPHEAAWPLLLGLLALHVGGAPEHHLVDRDATLTRMIAGQTRGGAR